jgi:hypothetical protein
MGRVGRAAPPHTKGPAISAVAPQYFLAGPKRALTAPGGRVGVLGRPGVRERCSQLRGLHAPPRGTRGVQGSGIDS